MKTTSLSQAHDKLLESFFVPFIGHDYHQQVDKLRRDIWEQSREGKKLTDDDWWSASVLHIQLTREQSLKWMEKAFPQLEGQRHRMDGPLITIRRRTMYPHINKEGHVQYEPAHPDIALVHSKEIQGVNGKTFKFVLFSDGEVFGIPSEKVETFPLFESKGMAYSTADDFVEKRKMFLPQVEARFEKATSDGLNELDLPTFAVGTAPSRVAQHGAGSGGKKKAATGRRPGRKPKTATFLRGSSGYSGGISPSVLINPPSDADAAEILMAMKHGQHKRPKFEAADVSGTSTGDALHVGGQHDAVTLHGPLGMTVRAPRAVSGSSSSIRPIIGTEDEPTFPYGAVLPDWATTAETRHSHPHPKLVIPRIN